MSDGPVNIGALIIIQLEQLVLFLPVALVAIWLLRARWLVHLEPNPMPRTNALRQIAIGALSALAGLCISILPALIAGSYSRGTPGWQAFDYEAVRNVFAGVKGLALLFLIQSLFEESLFRGIGLSLLPLLLMKVAELLFLKSSDWRFGGRLRPQEDEEKQRWRRRVWLYCGLGANVVMSVGFALMHSQNPNVSPLALVNIAFAGLWLGLLFWRRASLLACWAAHFTWNFGLALIGLPISGLALCRAPLGLGIAGARPDLLSGGAFGPEASLPAAVAFAGLSAWLWWRLVIEARGVESAADAGGELSERIAI